MAPGRANQHRSYKISRCLSGKTRQRSVNARSRKYSALPKFGKDVLIAAARPKEEGRIAIVTNAGRAAVDADGVGANGFAGRETVSKLAAHATGAICVRQNRVVLAPGVCAPSVAVMWRSDRTRAPAIRKATGAIVHRSPGRARHKPFQPLRREGRDVLATPVCRCAASHHADSAQWTSGASGLPVFPAPSFISEGEATKQSSGEISRENEKMCLRVRCESKERCAPPQTQ